jgi:hypothetical protein
MVAGRDTRTPSQAALETVALGESGGENSLHHRRKSATGKKRNSTRSSLNGGVGGTTARARKSTVSLLETLSGVSEQSKRQQENIEEKERAVLDAEGN